MLTATGVGGFGSEIFQERERLRREEAARQAREEAEAEQRKREEEEAARRAVQEAAEREAALEQRRLEKAMALGVEPEKGPDVTQVCISIFGFCFLSSFLSIDFIKGKCLRT